MEIIVRANEERFKVTNMCDALDEILEYHFKGKLEAGWQQGLEQGKETGKINTLLSLVRDGLLSAEEAAKRTDMTVEEIQNLLLSRKEE